MSDSAAIGFAAVYIITILAFCYLLWRITNKNAEQQDLLLERIQRPSVRPVAVTEDQEPEVEERYDLGEMAAVGTINPYLGSRPDEPEIQ